MDVVALLNCLTTHESVIKENSTPGMQIFYVERERTDIVNSCLERRIIRDEEVAVCV